MEVFFIDNLYWIWIARMEHICFEHFNALMYEYGGIEPIWEACLDGSIINAKLPKRVIDELMDCSKMKGLEKCLTYMKKERDRNG